MSGENTKTERTQISVYLDNDLLDEVRRTKERTGISQSALVEQGLRMRLAQLLEGGE